MKKIIPSQNASRIILTSPQEYRDCAVEMIGKGRRTLRLFSPDLEHDIYDNDELAQAVLNLSRVSRNSEIRILVRDTQPAIKRGHRLLDLSRRLTSIVDIRKFTIESNELPTYMLLVDEAGVMIRADEQGQDTGFASIDDRGLNNSLALVFDELWHRSRSDFDLRGVTI
jgi:hypothetical protein